MPRQIPDPRVIPSVESVRAAADGMRAVLPPSRLLRSGALQAATGRDVWLKCEADNPTGSFKVRGAYTVLDRMPPDVRAAGVVASSAGNHGLGVAYAAKAFGAPALLFVPRDAPQVKKDGIRALGASVNDTADDYDVAMAMAKAHGAAHGVPYINPCLGLDLLAGQGTVALEVLEQLPTVGTVVICTGGGGLLGGMGAVLRALAPTVHVVGAQSVRTAAMTRSLAAGTVVPIDNVPTLADGLAGQIDEDALHIGQVCADEMVLCSEAEIGETIAWMWRHHEMRLEGAGAVAVAAVRHRANPDWPEPIVAVASGRNIDDARFTAQLASFREDSPD